MARRPPPLPLLLALAACAGASDPPAEADGAEPPPEETSGAEGAGPPPSAETSDAEGAEAATPAESLCSRTSDLAAYNEGWLRTQAAWFATRVAVRCDASRPGPADLLGRPTYVRCDPGELCSAGPDGAPETADDLCAPIDPRGDGPRVFVDAATQPGCEGPTQAAAHFFGALLRDEPRLEALGPAEERSEGLVEGVEEWRKAVRCDGLASVQLASILCPSEDRCSLRVAHRVGARERTGRVEVRRSGAGWRVTDTATGALIRHPGC
ncbi:MAG TPA: hypothetical protein RMH85_34510 [Polyangiaceae bacterium LLY-WYZ-15_(1-7)]|nr:hypothetical protein [Myxococcales bacterium]MAT28863.1 hypothetical protein [Sandaracinus sp.]HJL02963.1 hypothetical protein [Polyangiaceae bacterium LLY-WYZ-15_(1-7)]MBJ74084.1 hypothetical protein [Sandaracinus sp.]HJL13649.1 hypothetical protein [Polyangiaceae bacterium LLY-WYZ-15_(1-7)]